MRLGLCKGNCLVSKLLMLIALVVSSCGPEARFAACRNDSECPDAEHGRAYCVRRRCVECITRASCGPHKECSEGRCVSSGK